MHVYEEVIVPTAAKYKKAYANAKVSARQRCLYKDA